MVIRSQTGLLLFLEDIWNKTFGRLTSQTVSTKKKPKMPSVESPESKVPTLNVTSTLAQSISNRTTQAAAAAATTDPSNNNNPTSGVSTSMKKPCWRRRTVHFTVFLAVFSTILSLLWIYTVTAELRRKAFDVNMTMDRMLEISMDNPQLVSFITNVQFKVPMGQEPLNATQTPEEEFLVSQLQGKTDGIYFEYISRPGASSTTGWLETNLGWRGVMIFPDPRNECDATRSSRSPKTRILHSGLSTDKEIKDISYHQEADVQVTKLGEGPNSLVFSKESLPATRLMIYPLFTILLAYNTTSIDYLNLDSIEPQLEMVPDTIPWESTRITVIGMHWGSYHTENETKSFINKMNRYHYKHVKTLDTGKLMFVYNRRLKILK